MKNQSLQYIQEDLSLYLVCDRLLTQTFWSFYSRRWLQQLRVDKGEGTFSLKTLVEVVCETHRNYTVCLWVLLWHSLFFPLTSEVKISKFYQTLEIWLEVNKIHFVKKSRFLELTNTQMLPPKNSFWAGTSDQSPLTGFQVWFKKFTPQASQDMSFSLMILATWYWFCSCLRRMRIRRSGWNHFKTWFLQK